MGYKYKVSALALMIGAGASGAWAADYDPAVGFVSEQKTSSANLVAVDFANNNAPVDVSQINPDGSFKSCATCGWIDPINLTQPQLDAIAADANAAKFDGKTARRARTLTDTTTGDSVSTTTTNGNVLTSSTMTNGAGASTTRTANGVTSIDASGDNKSVFSANGVTVVNTKAGASSSVTAGGASFTDAKGSTTIAGGDVTSTGTVTAGKVIAGGRDVGGSLDAFNGTGGTIETWASGVDSWRNDVNTTLSRYGGRLSSLEGWRDVAAAQISNLQGRMDKVEGGVALAMASKVPSLETGKTFGISVNVADFDGTGALAGGLAFRIDKNWQVNASGGAGFKGGASGGTVGLVGQW